MTSHASIAPPASSGLPVERVSASDVSDLPVGRVSETFFGYLGVLGLLSTCLMGAFCLGGGDDDKKIYCLLAITSASATIACCSTLLCLTLFPTFPRCNTENDRQV